MPKIVKANGKTFTFDDNVSQADISSTIDEYFGVKKKESSEPIAPKKQLESLAQPTQEPTLSATEEPQPQQVSGGLDGTLSELKIQPKPGTVLSAKNKIESLKKELASVKVTPKNQEEVSRKTDELSFLINKDKEVKKERLSNLEKTFKGSFNKDAAVAESEKRLNDLKTTTGVWNNIKSTSIDIYNKAIEGAAALTDEAGIKELKIDVDPLSEFKKEAKLKSKVKLSPQELNAKAEQLYKDREVDNIETDNVNSFLDNLDDNDRLLLRQLKKGQAEHLNEDNLKQQKVINAYEVIGNKKIDEFENLKKQLLVYKNNNQPLPKDLYDSFVSIGNEVRGISADIQKRKSAIDKNKSDLGTVNQEFDFLKRQYGDVDNAISNIGLAGTKILNGIIGFTNYAAKFGGGAQGQLYSLAGQQVAQDINNYISDKEGDLRKEVKSIESAEGFVNYASDLVAKQIPNLLVASTGIGGLGAIGMSSTGEKFTNMNQEVLDGKASYSPMQMAVAPVLYGGAEVISEIPTASILKKGSRVFESIIKNESDLITKSVKEKAKEWAKDYGIDMSKELAGEEFTNFTQNFTDKYVLGKKDVGLLDNTGTVFKDTFTLTSILKAAPHIAGAILKPLQKTSDLTLLDENSRKIIEFSKQLNSEALTDVEKSVINDQIKKATVENSKIIANTINQVDNMPDEVYKKIIELNDKAAKLKTDAIDISNGNLPNKDYLIDQLKNEYRDVQTERTALIDAKYEPKAEVITEAVKPIEVISPETSSNYANLTEDKEGDFVFFHVGGKGYDKIKKSTGGTLATSKEEGAALGKVGGVAMYYTRPGDTESMVKGDAKYAVTIPKEKVYDANTDANNYTEEAKTRHEEEHPGKAFDSNTKLAYITKIAGENGYDMVVSEWMGKTRAQTTKEFVAKDVQLQEGNKIVKPFEEEYVSNTDLGYESIIPESKYGKFDSVYKKIREERNKENVYDDLYQLYGKDTTSIPQEDITKLVEESDLSQEVKDMYAEALAYEPGIRRTEVPFKPVTIENAPEGDFLNIGLNIGTTAELLDKKDVISMLPKGVKVLEEGIYDVPSEIDGKKNIERTLLVKLSRPLTKAEMTKLLEDTQQKAIPQLTGGKGLMYGSKEWGNFDPEYFHLPKDGKLADFISKKPAVEVKPTIKSKLAAFKTKYIEKPVYDRTKLNTQVENAKKSLSKLLPDVKFVVHDTKESFIGVAGKNGRGFYDPATKTIHINALEANARTVAHEVFHSILLDKVKTDANARELTKKMITAISRTLEGNPELKKTLDDFVKNYDENIQNEEKLSELFGYLADGYEGFSAPTKSIIKRTMDRLAKMFGLKPFTEGEIVDMLRTLSGKVATGKEIVSKDIKAISEGASSYIAEPTNIERFQKTNEEDVIVGDHKLSFVKKSDLIDIDALMKDITSKNQKVWFWVADQLGRGNYFDSKIDGEHYLDAGPSFALDPINRDKNVIWASGKNEKEINNLIGKSDYLFIISGSPEKSKLFNKSIIDIVAKRAGNFNKFKKDILESSKIKSINDILSSVKSWEELKDSTKRKEFLLSVQDQKDKNTPLRKTLDKYNSIVDLNEIRDGFYSDNNFGLNDIMLVLKPTGFGGKSDHSTYENNILGEVVGVPDIKVNAFDIMPSEVKDKYKEDLGKSMQQQVVAPYGIGVKQIERFQESEDYSDMKEIVKDMIDDGMSITDIKKIVTDELGPDSVSMAESAYNELTTVKKEPFKGKQKERSVLKRIKEGGNAEYINEIIDKIGINYTQRNQQQVIADAEAFVDEVGIENAYEAIKNGSINNGDSVTVVYASIIDRIPSIAENAIEDAKTESEKEAVKKEYNELLETIFDEFSKRQTDIGQATAILNALYIKNQEVMYSLSVQKEKYKAINAGVIDEETLKKFEALDKRYTAANKKIKELESKLKESVDEQNFKNIVEEYSRVTSKENIGSKARNLAKDIRSGKKAILPSWAVAEGAKGGKTQGITFEKTFAKALETFADVHDATKDFAKAIEEGFKVIKQWYANNNIDFNEKDIKSKFSEYVNPKAKKLTVTKGVIKIPSEIISNYVANGGSDINELSEQILNDSKDEYPNLTVREIRDNISKYGSRLNKTRTQLAEDILRLKSLGRLESQLEDLKKGISKSKNEVKKRALSDLEKKYMAQIKAMKNALGITETERTTANENYIRRRIEQLKEKIKNNDFAKKEVTPIKESEELKKLKTEKNRVQEEYDKIIYTKELENRTVPEKITGFLSDMWDAQRVTRATGELSFVGAQGGFYMINSTFSRKTFNSLVKNFRGTSLSDWTKSPIKTISNIIRSATSAETIIEMFNKMGTKNNYDDYQALLKAHPYYDVFLKSKLRILSEDVKTQVRDEMFIGNHFLHILKLPFTALTKLEKGKKRITVQGYYERLKTGKVSEKNIKTTEEIFEAVNPLGVFERGNNTFMNMARVEMFMDGVQALEMQGKNPIDHLQDYKDLASAVNTVTGSGNLVKSVAMSLPILNKIFFSPRFWAASLNMTPPISLYYLAKLGNYDSVTLSNPKSWGSIRPTVAQKVFVKPMLKGFIAFYGMSALVVSLINSALDDDDEMTEEEKDKKRAYIEYDPRSSNFMQVISGDTRTDFFGPYRNNMVLFSRLFTGQTSKDGNIIENGAKWGSRTDFQIGSEYIAGKANPFPGMFVRYSMGKKEEVLNKETKLKENRRILFDDDVSIANQTKENLLPIFVGTVKDIVDEDPVLGSAFYTTLALFGKQTSVYKKKVKSKMSDEELKKLNPRAYEKIKALREKFNK